MKLFITFELKGFLTWGRERHNFSMTIFPSAPPPPHAAPNARPWRAPKVNRILPRQELNSLTFLKSQPTLPVHDVTHHLVLIPIWDFYFDISEWHILSAHAWTPTLMLHLTNPCAKRKVLSRTKPKGKIYKTISLGHFITMSFIREIFVIDGLV